MYRKIVTQLLIHVRWRVQKHIVKTSDFRSMKMNATNIRSRHLLEFKCMLALVAGLSNYLLHSWPLALWYGYYCSVNKGNAAIHITACFINVWCKALRLPSDEGYSYGWCQKIPVCACKVVKGVTKDLCKLHSKLPKKLLQVASPIWYGEATKNQTGGDQVSDAVGVHRGDSLAFGPCKCRHQMHDILTAKSKQPGAAQVGLLVKIAAEVGGWWFPWMHRQFVQVLNSFCVHLTAFYQTWKIREMLGRDEIATNIPSKSLCAFSTAALCGHSVCSGSYFALCQLASSHQRLLSSRY